MMDEEDPVLHATDAMLGLVLLRLLFYCYCYYQYQKEDEEEKKQEEEFVVEQEVYYYPPRFITAARIPWPILSLRGEEEGSLV